MNATDTAAHHFSPTLRSPAGHFSNAEDAETAERLLSEDVERLVTRLGSALHAMGGGDRIGDQAAHVFLQTNGLAVASPYPSHGATGANTGKGGLPPDLATTLHGVLLEARTLIRRLDSERRHHRKEGQRRLRELGESHQVAQAAQREAMEGNRLVRSLEAQLAAAKERVRVAEDDRDDATMEAMRLRKFVRALPSPAFASGLATMEEAPERTDEVASVLQLVPDRRFSEAFADKMAAITYRRRYRTARRLHQETCERLEALSMEKEDPSERPVRVPRDQSTGEMAASAELPGGGGGGGLRLSSITGGASGPSTAAAATAALLGGSRGVLDFPFQLPFSPSTPKDELIKTLVYHSQFAEPLNQGRGNLLRLSTRVKSSLDGGLRSLYSIHLDTLRSSGMSESNLRYYRRSFEQQLQKLESAQRELLFSVVSTTNKMTMGVVDVEKARRGGGGGMGAGRQTRDVGTMACDTTMADYHLHLADERVNQLRLRALETESACAKKLEEAEQARQETRQKAFHILANLEMLGKATTDAARLTQRRSLAHREHSSLPVSTIADPFELVRTTVKDPSDMDDPRLDVKVTEATELALSYVRHLTLSGGSGPAQPVAAAAPFARVSEALAGLADLEDCSETAHMASRGFQIGEQEGPAEHPPPHAPLTSAPTSRAPRKLSLRSVRTPSSAGGGRRQRSHSAGSGLAHRSASNTRRHTLPTLETTRTPKARAKAQRLPPHAVQHQGRLNQASTPNALNVPRRARRGNQDVGGRPHSAGEGVAAVYARDGSGTAFFKEAPPPPPVANYSVIQLNLNM